MNTTHPQKRGHRHSSKRNRILVGDVREKLQALPAESIDTVITSPPYFRLRNYGSQKQIGLEVHVDEWVEELRTVFLGLHRVLKPTGSVWLNLGDTYSGGVNDGAVAKSLLLAPERLALALQEDGWILRNKVIWAKPNPMPTSVKDRLACAYEVVYFLTKSKDYFFDLDAIRVPHAGSVGKSKSQRPSWSVPPSWRGPSAGSNSGLDRLKAQGMAGHPLGKNPGDVWSVATAGFRGAHHAVFPLKLIERPLLATCPEQVCAACGVPWRRGPPTCDSQHPVSGTDSASHTSIGAFGKSCDCKLNETNPGVVLDPFMGSGTTAIVAEDNGREWIGVEVNPDFAELAKVRIEGARSSGRRLGRVA
jgi:site-specific DNA-methyltransferase (adenine-specific)